jgi:hypothetical protein
MKTPRTEAVVRMAVGPMREYAIIEHAQSLERELIESTRCQNIAEKLERKIERARKKVTFWGIENYGLLLPFLIRPTRKQAIESYMEWSLEDRPWSDQRKAGDLRAVKLEVYYQSRPTAKVSHRAENQGGES